MPVVVTCAACGSNLKAPDSVAGHRIKCPECREPVAVPKPAGRSTSEEAGFLATPLGQEAPGSRDEFPREGRGIQGPTIAYTPEERGRYTLDRLHAKGGIGQVWLARDPDLGREVALKELRPERADDVATLQRFLAEAQITGQLEHPGIVPVYELVRRPDGDRTFYTMRFVRGQTLRRAARAHHKKRTEGSAEPLDLRALLNAFVGACNAVAYAHSRGVVHRDLKGENVVLGDFGEVVVLDWGLAKLLGEADEGAELPPVALSETGERDDTVQGQVLGTPAYMAPEQAKGRADLIDARTDVYGLGAMLYEILTGQPPYAGTNTQEILRQVLEDEPPPPRELVADVSRSLEAICLKALSKRQKDRYVSAAELAADVQRWLADEPVTAYREAAHRRLARWGRRHPTLVTAAGVLAVAVLAGGFWLKHERDTRTAQIAQESARTEGLVQADLRDVMLRVRQTDPDGAREAMERAQDRLAGSSGELQRRIRETRAALEMVGKLERVLLLETFTAGKFENGPANAAYQAAFQEHGLDVMSLGPVEAAQRITQSSIREQLVTALDDWIFVLPRNDGVGRKRLLLVVGQADDDAWRQQLRDPVMHKDRAALEKLAQSPHVTHQPPSILVHFGKYLAQAGAWKTSVEVLQRAQRRYAGDFWVNYALAMSLAEQTPSRTVDAVGYFRAALALRPQSYLTHLMLGLQFVRLGQTADALTHFRAADELVGPRQEASLRFLLQHGQQHDQTGVYALALLCFKAAEQLMDSKDERKPILTKLVGRTDRMARLDEQIPAILRGDVKLASAEERALVAQICQLHRRLYATAARFFQGAFAAQPTLAEDMVEQHRYNAACAAALAAAGQGEDAADLEPAARAAWRKQALEWLNADLVYWTKTAQAADVPTRVKLLQTLTHWQFDADLSGLRDPEALAKLPESDQDEFRKLWQAVTVLLDKIRTT